jgi:hypothetical protein
MLDYWWIGIIYVVVFVSLILGVRWRKKRNAKAT